MEYSEDDSLSDASTIISDITAEDDTNDSCFQEDTRELGDEMSTENLGDEALIGNCSNSKSEDHKDETTPITQGNIGVPITEQVEKVSELVVQPLSKLEHVGNTCDEDESDLLTMDEDDIDMLNEQIESSFVQESIGPEGESCVIKQNTEVEEEGIFG